MLLGLSRFVEGFVVFLLKVEGHRSGEINRHADDLRPRVSLDETVRLVKAALLFAIRPLSIQAP